MYALCGVGCIYKLKRSSERDRKMTRQQWALDYLNWKKVCYGFKTTYENNEPVKTEFLPVKITKKDQFFRANGKVISKIMALELYRLGMGV